MPTNPATIPVNSAGDLMKRSKFAMLRAMASEPDRDNSLQWLEKLAGRFLVFDGPDGSGKSTQTERFRDACRAAGLGVLETREPGGTSIGEQIRRILLDPENIEMSLRCEMMLYMASRSQLIEEKIRPALETGKLVLADRFISSTLAYQGTAGGMSAEEILTVGKVAVGDIWPDLTVVFDVDEATAAKRLNPLLDRMEQKGAEFHRRVRRGFLDQANLMPEKYLVVDARQEPVDVFDQLVKGIHAKLVA